MVTSCTDQTHPYYEAVTALEPDERVNFFTGENAFHMQHVSLGEALDFICTGAAMNCVGWDLDPKKLTVFVKAWMDAQRPRITHKRVPIKGITSAYTIEEKSREHGYLWNRFDADFDEALPWIDYKFCPRDKQHKGILQKGNIVRCAHVGKQFIKPSFLEQTGPYLDEFSGLMRPHFYEGHPLDGFDESGEDEDEELPLTPKNQALLEKKQARLRLFDSEEQEEILDPCYAILSDKGTYLPLESILCRLNTSSSGSNGCVFPFSGFTLASFAKAWYNQPTEGPRQLFLPDGKIEGYRVYKNFQVISSED